MFTRKQQSRLTQVLNLALVAIVLNLIMPVRASAQTLPTPFTGHSHAVISQPTASRPISARSQLPASPDKPLVVSKTLVVRASAYSSTVDQCDGDPFTTASGAKVHDGTLAANGLPFGTKVRIPQYYGDKVFTIEDRMNAAWGNQRVDIWMPTRAAAMQWGVRTVSIELVS